MKNYTILVSTMHYDDGCSVSESYGVKITIIL